MIGILTTTDSAKGRGVLIGAVRQARLMRMPTLHVDVGPELPDLDSFGLTGLVAAIDSPALREMVDNSGLPAINVSARFERPPTPAVLFDDHAIGRLAAESFLERGYDHLAVCTVGDHGYSIARLAGFLEAAAEADVDVPVFRQQEHSGWRTLVDEIRAWLSELPKPAAVFASNDQRARRVIEACMGHFKVPEQIAVLGVDNDPAICEAVTPALSSIEPNHEKLGAVAMLRLRERMDGRTDLPDVETVAPSGVVMRASTQLAASVDPVVLEAIRYIDAHLSRPLSVDDVAEAIGVSRRMLERRFRSDLQRSPAAEIRRLKMAHAQALLRQTRWPLTRIATACGFEYMRHFASAFKQQTGITPTAYRQQFEADVELVE